MMTARGHIDRSVILHSEFVRQPRIPVGIDILNMDKVGSGVVEVHQVPALPEAAFAVEHINRDRTIQTLQKLASLGRQTEFLIRREIPMVIVAVNKPVTQNSDREDDYNINSHTRPMHTLALGSAAPALIFRHMIMASPSPLQTNAPSEKARSRSPK